MKPLFAVTFAVWCASVVRGGPTERVIVAAMKLSEQPGYSWRSTVSDDARTYDIEGRRDPSGYTWLRLPMVKAVAERLGRDAEPEIEAVFRGGAAFVIRTDRGWKTFKELPKRAWDWDDGFDSWPAPAGARARVAAAALAGLDPLDAPVFPPPYVPPPPPDEDERRPYSNAQLALSHPHDELAVIVSSYTALQVEGDVAAGLLSDVGARLLLVHEGQDHIKPLCAAGCFRLVIKNGMVARYQLRLEGILVIDRKKIHVRQESTTEIANVGATSFAVADEIRRKLER